MKLVEFRDYAHYLEAQRKTLRRRRIGPFFSWWEMERICDWLKLHISVPSAGVRGVCHGARDGIEVDEFKKHFPGASVFGTDLFPFSGRGSRGESEVIEHDFSVQKPEWVGKFDFVYSNSLDHARDPVACLRVWFDQLKPTGYLFVQWYWKRTGAKGGDCFGAEVSEVAQMMDALGELVELIYCSVPFQSGNRLQRHGLKVIVLVARRG